MLTLEVVPVPVSDVDAALAFYRDRLGFTLDVDYRPTDTFRVVQLTPPGSACSVHLEAATSDARLHGPVLVTTDLVAEGDRLLAAGVTVSEIKHKDPVGSWSGHWQSGIDAERRDYASAAEITDPDGNTWIVQERGYRAAGGTA